MLKDNIWKVLVVDDNPGMRMLLEQVLIDAGYQVDTATDGLNALDKFEREPPDVVLVDMKMPGMTGLEFVGRLNAVQAYPEIVLMTAYRDREIMNRAKELGIRHYLIKPFNMEDLLGLITKLS